jgi:hypothetical protein
MIREKKAKEIIIMRVVLYIYIICLICRNFRYSLILVVYDYSYL